MEKTEKADFHKDTVLSELRNLASALKNIEGLNSAEKSVLESIEIIHTQLSRDKRHLGYGDEIRETVSLARDIISKHCAKTQNGYGAFFKAYAQSLGTRVLTDEQKVMKMLAEKLADQLGNEQIEPCQETLQYTARACVDIIRQMAGLPVFPEYEDEEKIRKNFLS